MPARATSPELPPPELLEGRQPAPPVKRPTWKWYIPIYFWSGGIAAGAWLAATVEDVAGEGDADVVRAGRYLALGGMLVGTALLIDDLGRQERFLNMLRIVRARSTMSVGSWGLAQFGAVAGLGAALQMAQDGLLGERAARALDGRRAVGRAVHLAGLPLALFVGSYTGVLLGTTSIPTWARRVRLLGPLFGASAVSSGLAAVSLALDAQGHPAPSVRRRLARAEAVSLATELALAIEGERRARWLPSARTAPRRVKLARWVTFGAGMLVPLVAQVARGWASESEMDHEADTRWRRRRERDRRGRHPGRRHRRGRRSRRARLVEREENTPLSMATAGLALAGSLALRFLITREGYRSARTPGDTWAVTGGEVYAGAMRPMPARPRAGRMLTGPPTPRRAEHAELEGRITIVQEDRIRVVNDAGRGYLLTVGKRLASLRQLERWRDSRTRVRVRYSGLPDAGARVERIAAR
jgi:formate-dependent nitrite reductase membrane component NrfD